MTRERFWGFLFANSGHRSRRLTRWLYRRYLAARATPR